MDIYGLTFHLPPIVTFLEEYQSHKEAQKANSALIAQFISSLVPKQELTSWTVVLIGGGQKSNANSVPLSRSTCFCDLPTASFPTDTRSAG